MSTDFGKAAAAAAAAATFGSQFGGLQPFSAEDSLYPGYSTYNNWAAAKAAATTPTSLAKGFGSWGFHSDNLTDMMSSAISTTTAGSTTTSSSTSPSASASPPAYSYSPVAYAGAAMYNASNTMFSSLPPSGGDNLALEKAAKRTTS
jgi:hypothetical protein